MAIDSMALTETTNVWWWWYCYSVAQTWGNSSFDVNSLSPMQLLFVDQGITDGVTIPDERSDLGTDRPPQPGRAQEFNGTSDLITIPSVSLTTNATLAIRFNADTVSFSSRAIIGGINGVKIRLASTTTILVQSDAATFNFVVPTMSVSTWYSLIVSKTGTSIRLYLNGTESSSGVQTITGGYNFTIIGARPAASDFFDGRLSDCRMWSKVLSADERTYYSSAYATGANPGLSDIGHWKLDSTSTTTSHDSSGNAKHGTKTGTTVYTGKDVPYSWQQEVGYTDTAGNLIPRDESAPTLDVLGGALQYTGKGKRPAKLVQSGCLDFDGTGDYITLPSTITLTCDATSKWSVSYRYRQDKQRAMLLGTRGDDNNRIYHDGSNNILRIVLNDGTYMGFNHDPDDILGTHAVVVITYDGSIASAEGRFTCRVNGTAITTAAGTYVGAATSLIIDTIGKAYVGSASFDWDGLAYDVRIWNNSKALTTAESQYVETLGGSGTDPGNPTAWWPLVRLGAYDVVGTNHGTIVGGITAATQDVFHYAATKGFDWCGNFDGVNDYVSIGNPHQIGTSDFSFAAFIRLKVIALSAIMAKSTGSGTNGGWIWEVQAAGKVRIWIHDSTGSAEFAGNTTLLADRWYHVAVVCDRDGNTTHYVNGAPDGVGSLSAKQAGLTAVIDQRIGSVQNGARYPNGQIRDMCEYHRVLTADEVLYLATNGESGTAPSATNLKGHWPIYDGVGLTVEDIAGANNGTVNGATSDEFWAHRVPAKADGTSLIHGGTPSHPYVTSGFNGGCKIDFTGGVAMAGTSSWETAWAWHATRSNPLFHREVEITDTDIVEACDRFVAFPAALAGGDLDDVVAYTETIDVFDDTYDETF